MMNAIINIYIYTLFNCTLEVAGVVKTRTVPFAIVDIPINSDYIIFIYTMIKIFTLFYREIYLIQKLRITFISKLFKMLKISFIIIQILKFISIFCIAMRM